MPELCKCQPILLQARQSDGPEAESVNLPKPNDGPSSRARPSVKITDSSAPRGYVRGTQEPVSAPQAQIGCLEKKGRSPRRSFHCQ
jgi:hypothetical protein